MILALALLLVISQSNLIISISTTNSEVSANNQLGVRILTSSAISANTLTVTFPADFTVSQPCLVNGTSVACSFLSTSSSLTVSLASILSTNTYYLLTFNLSNPYYSSNFPISAAVSGVAFSNTALISISPKTIVCSQSASSSLVSDTSIATFTLGNDVLPTGSVITINSTLQTTFSNLFATSPVCMINNITFSCLLSTSFGQQFLKISGVPQTSNQRISVSFMNNAPYNASMGSVNIQIQNAAGFFMQVCSLQQPSPTVLRTSGFLAVAGWNQQVGSTSTATFTLSPNMVPYSTTLLWVLPTSISVTPLSPTSTSTSILDGRQRLLISGASIIGNSLTFTAQITNPTSLENLTSDIYIVYSSTLFIEQLTVTTMSLSPLVLTPTASLTNYLTQTNSTYNITLSIPYTISNGISSVITLDLGSLWCSSLGLISSLVLSNVSCTSGRLYFTSSAVLNQGVFWVSFNVSNHLSARQALISLSLSNMNNLLIGSGSTSIQLIQNQHSFTVLNTITTFAVQTIFRITQDVSLINVDSSITRIFSLNLPKDLQLYQNTSIIGILNTSIITSSINSIANQISIRASGRLQVQIIYLNNPIKFNGSLQWSIIATDILGNPSSNFKGDHTPLYTSTTSFMNVSITNPTIQAETPITITLIPALQYQNAPLITLSFSDSIVFNCTSCTVPAANAASFTYSGAVMRLYLYIKNSNKPNGNVISGVISLSTITFETIQISYTLDPMIYGYVVQQKGLFGSIGSLNITIKSKPTQALTLTYSSVSPVLSDQSCVICNSDQLYLTGIIGFFQSSSVSLTGTFNGVIYAKATVLVSYVCSVVQGCRICDAADPSVCQQCFNSSLTPYSLLYQGGCLQNCPLATYSDGRTCISCPNLCDSCNVISCNLCRASYYLYNGSCLKPCPSPLVNNATHCITVPIRCPTNCASCPYNDVCTACQGGYYLLDNVCYSSCPAGYNPQGGQCILFVPPQQTSYFPFPFIISSFLIFTGLLAVKCFEKRSLVMGNLIALLSLVEVGSLLMTISYSLKGSNDILTQALVFMVLFSKVALNLIFLFYFLKAIACEEQFLRWRQAQQAHEGIYRTLVALGSIFSFQLVRVLYSRLLGLRLFFGKFNTSLIFRPINRFSIAHFCTSGAALVALSVRTLLLQEGYQTSAYFSSLESLVMEGVLLIACIVDSCKGYDSQFFEYQVYKVDNEYEASHIDPIQIQNQAEESRGSLHQIINAVGSSKLRKQGGIYRNPLWLKKQFDPLAIPSQGSQIEESQRKMQQGEKIQASNTKLSQNLHSTNAKLKGLKLVSSQINLQVPTSKSIPKDITLLQEDKKPNQAFQGLIQNKNKGVFRRKIIQQWRQLQKKLPNKMKELRKGSNINENSVRRSLKRTSSVQQLQIELPKSPTAIPQKIRKHFEEQSQNNKERQLKKVPSKNKYASFYASKSLSQCQQEQIEEIDQLPIRTGNKYKGIKFSGEDILGQYQVDKQQGDLLEGFINNDQPGDARTELQDEQEEEQLQGEDAANLGEIGSDQEEDNSEPKQNERKKKKKIDLGNYRYGGQEQRQKKYRTKRRRVNRETEKVYLQRLVGSSDQKLRSKSRNLQF